MGYSLGIDIGTTYTGAGVARDGRASIFPLGDDRPTIPTVVLLRDDGEVLIGDAAERRAQTEPTRVARQFKRRMGDHTPIIVGGTPYGVEALTAHVLRWVVARVVEQEGTPPDTIVLTHPAAWGTYKLDLLSQAARLADIGGARFMGEPQAAAVRYAREGRVAVGDIVAVYDFGGGTFDVALVRSLGRDEFELLGSPEGMERLGGIDFDQAVYAHVDAAVDGMLGEADVSDRATRLALSQLRTECRRAKEALSSDTDTVIPLMLPGLQTELRLTRAEFEGMIRPRISETIDTLQRTVRSAGLGVEDLASVLLVGGTSRIPLIREMVQTATGVPVALDSHPKHAMALGAALRYASETAEDGSGNEGAPAGVAAGIPAAEAGPAAAVLTAAAAAQAVAPDLPPPHDAPPPPSPAPRLPPGDRRRWNPWLVLGAVAALIVVVILVTRGDGPSLPDVSATSVSAGESTITEGTATSSSSDTTATTAGTTTTSLGTTTSSSPTGVAASGWRRVTDESGTLTMEVPEAWRQVETAPTPFLGEYRPHISASPNMAGYLDTWETPGISMIAVERSDVVSTSDLIDSLDASIGYSLSCLPGVTAPYSDARFTGETRGWVDCDGTGNLILVVGADDGGAVLYVTVVQSSLGDNISALERALATVEYTG